MQKRTLMKELGMSDFEIITYASHNAPEARRWIAYISTSDQKDYWPIRFYGASEEAAKIRARAHYASCDRDWETV